MPRKATGTWTGRTVFEDLFVAESSTTDQARRSVTGKIDLFREMIKHSEKQIARFKKVWQVREREMDQLEKLYETERSRVDVEAARAASLAEELDAAQANVAQMQVELRGLQQTVQQLEREKNEIEQTWRERLDRATRERDELKRSARSAASSPAFDRAQSDPAPKQAEERPGAIRADLRPALDPLSSKEQRKVAAARRRLADYEQRLVQKLDRQAVLTLAKKCLALKFETTPEELTENIEQLGDEELEGHVLELANCFEADDDLRVRWQIAFEKGLPEKNVSAKLEADRRLIESLKARS